MNAPSSKLPATHARNLAKGLWAALFLLIGTGGVMAQTKLWEDTFNGGVVTGGYSQGATIVGPSSGNFSVSIPPGSTIRKAYLIGGRAGAAPSIAVTLNGTPYTFNGTNQVGPSFTTIYGGASGVHAIDVTADINPATTAYTIGVPLQPSTVADRYPEFYLFIAFNNASLPGTTAAVFCNTVSSAGTMPWTLSTTAPIINTSPVGLAIFGGYAAAPSDMEKVTVNGTLVGQFGGQDFNGSSQWGSMAGFQFYNNTLTGYNDDNANQAISGTDALSNIQALIPANTTSIPVVFDHATGGSDNHVWAVILTSAGNAVAPPPPAYSSGKVYWAGQAYVGVNDITAGGDQSSPAPFAATSSIADSGQMSWTADRTAAYVALNAGGQVVKVLSDGSVTVHASVPNCTGVVALADGRILASSFSLGKVFDVTAGGTFTNASPTFVTVPTTNPRTMIQLADGRILLCGYTTNAVYDITAGGAGATVFATLPNLTSDLAQMPDGRIFVAAYSAGIYDITTGGTKVLADAYVPGSSANFYPMGLAATGNGKLLAADGGGSFLTKILDVTAGGSPASAPVFAFSLPSGSNTFLDVVPGTVVTSTPTPVASTFGDVLTGNGAPNAAGADSGADFDALQRSGYLAQNGNLAFLGYLKTGTGGVDNTNFMGYWKHDGASLKLLARQGDNAPETGATAAKFNILPLIPGISDGGQVTLFASLLQSGLSTPATTADNDVGLWSELGGTGFQILIRENDDIPGLTAGTKVDSLGWGCFATATTGASTGEAAFVVGMKDTSTDTALLRTSVVSSNTTAVGVIARENSAAPGASENFGGLNNPVTRSVRMDALGNVCFAAGLASGKTGIWYQDQGTKTVRKTVLTGEAAPGTTTTFAQLDLPNMGGEGVFAFRAVLNQTGDNADNSKNDGIWKYIPDTQSIINVIRRGDSNMNRAGLFGAAYTGTYPNIKAGNIYNGWLTNSSFGAWLGWVDLGGDGISPFPYDGNFTASTDTFGIYTDTSGTMKLLIASGDAAPGITGSKFFFIDHPVCGGAQQAAFIATVNGGGTTSANNKGVWRTASNGGALSLALRTGDTMSVSVNGTPTSKTIADLDLPGSGYADHLWETPVMDSTGRLLVFVTFTDGSTTQVLVP